MTHSDYNTRTTSPEAEADPGNADAWQVLGDAVVNLLRLVRVETGVAVSRLPDMLLLWVLHVPALVLMWISFSILPAWTAYSLSGLVFPGLLVFFMLQVALVVLVNISMKRRLQAASFPQSRRYAHKLVASLLADPGLPEAANDDASNEQGQRK